MLGSVGKLCDVGDVHVIFGSFFSLLLCLWGNQLHHCLLLLRSTFNSFLVACKHVFVAYILLCSHHATACHSPWCYGGRDYRAPAADISPTFLPVNAWYVVSFTCRQTFSLWMPLSFVNLVMWWCSSTFLLANASALVLHGWSTSLTHLTGKSWWDTCLWINFMFV